MKKYCHSGLVYKGSLLLLIIVLSRWNAAPQDVISQLLKSCIDLVEVPLEYR